MTPAPSRRRLSLHNVLPSTKVFVAKTGDGAVAATVTVVEDSRLSLPVDEAIGRFVHRARTLSAEA